MSESFSFDVFLSHSSKDKAVVRSLAERLRADGLRVWFDDWEIRPGDSIPAKIEDGLERSRVLVLCMSGQAFGSDWAQLESGTFRFRDPLNKERRFIPLRLDDASIKGSLAQFLYINWLSTDREREYAKLLEACEPAKPATKAQVTREQGAEKVTRVACALPVWTYVFTSDGKRVLTADDGGGVRVWDLATGECLRALEGHTGPAMSVVVSSDQRCALSGSVDNTVRLWDLRTGRRLRLLRSRTDKICSVALSDDQEFALSGARNGTLRLWALKARLRPRALEGHRGAIWGIAWNADQRHILSGSADTTARLWEVSTGRCMFVLEGHTRPIKSVAWSADQRLLLTGSEDKTIRLWEAETGRCLRIFEGHGGGVNSAALSADQQLVLSGSADRTVRVWDLKTGRCLRLLKGHSASVISVAWGVDQRRVFSGDFSGNIRVWDLSELIAESRAPTSRPAVIPALSDQVQYTNAKVLLVGESGVGKTGLSKILAGEKWKPSDSTVGAWATQWKLPVSSGNGIEREIWLWDFGGQADQRLVHQLYMEDTALAVLVFDGQKEDLFETLGQWDRDLTRASQKTFTKLLVAGRVDAGGLRVSRSQIDRFAEERGFARYLETSAKGNLGCKELKDAIVAGIRWADIPWRSSPLLFKRLREEIIGLKEEGRVLMRFNELRDALRLRLAGEKMQFNDDELNAVVGLLAGPGVVWELAFGSWVLLQPERINAYAQAVIQTLRADEHERGAIAEESVLRGNLTYHSSVQRIETDEERFVLLAMHQTLVERGLCLREHTDNGPLLIFPSYYRRERPELVGHPAVLVSYRFGGFLDDIYATLVVRLHHTKPFRQDQLWRYAADFKTLTGRQLGVKLTRRAEGTGELEVYFDPAIPLEEKIIFSRYVHEHLLQKGQDVVRLRHYVCQHCGTSVGNREVATERLEAWLAGRVTTRTEGSHAKVGQGRVKLPTIVCSKCENRVPLWDDLEQCFASPDTQELVGQLQEQSASVLDNESKERALVGEVISTVALAGQISRELSVSDHGIDMEIEFKNDAGEATGKKLYLQLKSGDSYLRERRGDGAEVFEIKKERHVNYWTAQAFPVMLVIRTSEGEVRWMEVRDWLKRASGGNEKPVKRIIFEGTRFDVMSVRRWRDDVLAKRS
jgi:small GTP-binding protein